MSATDTRRAALAAFDQGRASFTDELAAAPGDALGYLKPGDDYALGGLVFHVNSVLEHYLGVLDALAAGDAVASDRPRLFEQAGAKARAGCTAAERGAALAETRRLHDAVRARIDSLPVGDFERQAQVTQAAGAETYLASAADVLGWLTGHYEEHVPHVQELLAEWRASR